jgi:hypothetical protein
MLKRLLVLTAILSPIAILAAGCGQAAQSHGGPVRDHVSFVDALRAKGVTVDIVGTINQPFLHPQSGTSLRISGGVLPAPADLQSFDYPSAAAASADAGQIQPDGSLRGVMVDWVGPPHFFRAERLLVIYVGSDASVISLLTGVLGPQIAGR